jgi:hypothetical protein
LTATVYGGAVSAKVVLLVVALAVAGLHAMRVNPVVSARVCELLGRRPGWTPVEPRRLALLLTLEATVLLVAVGTAALLTTIPTAREVGDARRATAPQTATADGLFITFEDIAAGPERSRLVVRVRATVRPAPAPVVGVDVDLTDPRGRLDPVRLARVDEGRFEVGTRPRSPGAWSATVRVHRRGLPDTVTRATWTIAPPAGAHVTRVEVVGTVLTVLLLLLAGLAPFVGRRRPTRHTPVPAAPVRDREVSVR